MLDPRVEQMYHQYYSPLYQFLYRRTRSRERAEDVAHEVFRRAISEWEKIREYPEKGLRYWLYTVANRLLTDEWRRTQIVTFQRLSDDFDPADEGVVDPQDVVAQRDNDTLTALSRMSEHDRQLLLLRVVEELSYLQIASLTGRTLTSVKSQLYRARAALRIAYTAVQKGA